KIDAFRGDSAFGSWIYRIVANAALIKRRRNTRRRDAIPLDDVFPWFDENGHHVEPIDDWSTRIDDPAIQRELQDALTAAVHWLRDHSRAVIVMHDVEGLPIAEVAEVLGLTASTVKSRAHRARLMLRKRLAVFMSEEADLMAMAS